MPRAKTLATTLTTTTLIAALLLCGAVDASLTAIHCECPDGCVLRDIVHESMVHPPRGTRCNRGVRAIRKPVVGRPGMSGVTATFYRCTHRVTLRSGQVFRVPDYGRIVTHVNGCLMNWMQHNPKLNCGINTVKQHPDHRQACFSADNGNV
jgi:hypothetical protein